MKIAAIFPMRNRQNAQCTIIIIITILFYFLFIFCSATKYYMYFTFFDWYDSQLVYVNYKTQVICQMYN